MGGGKGSDFNQGKSENKLCVSDIYAELYTYIGADKDVPQDIRSIEEVG